MSVDLPEPDTPVIATSCPSGIDTSTFLRLCSRAPRMVIDAPERATAILTGRAGDCAVFFAAFRRTRFPHRAPLPRPELDRVIGAGDDRRIVLDDDDGVAGVLQASQHGEQPLAVARVQSDRRLVDDVHRLGQRAAERRGEIDALRFAAGQRARLTIEREVRQPDFIEVHEPVHDLAAQMPGHRLLLLRQRQVLPESPRGLHVHREQIGDGQVAELHVRRGGLEPRSVAVRTRLVAAVLRELHADVDLVLLRLQPFEEAFDAVPLRAAVVEQVPLGRRELIDRHIESQPYFFAAFSRSS